MELKVSLGWLNHHHLPQFLESIMELKASSVEPTLVPFTVILNP